MKDVQKKKGFHPKVLIWPKYKTEKACFELALVKQNYRLIEALNLEKNLVIIESTTPIFR